jgi:hypothetical protein
MENGAHYNQSPDGWNGFATVAEYYNTFNAADTRAKYSTPAIIASYGNPVDIKLGNNLLQVLPRKTETIILYFFTPELTLITSGKTLETAGIRGVKYIPDSENLNSRQ